MEQIDESQEEMSKQVIEDETSPPPPPPEDDSNQVMDIEDEKKYSFLLLVFLDTWVLGKKSRLTIKCCGFESHLIQPCQD